MWSKRVIVVLAVVAPLAGAGGIYAFSGYASDAPAVTTESLKQVVIDRRVSLVGPVLPRDNATVVPRLPSRILRLFVHEGDVVEKGAKLALLDANELGIDVERKQVALDQVRLRGQPSDSATHQLDIRAAELDLLRAKTVFAEATLIAPIAGTVVQVSAREGDMLSPMRASSGEGIIIAATRDFAVHGEVDEFDAHHVQQGASAQVRFAVGGAAVPARVLSHPVLRRFRPDARQAATFEIAVGLDGPLPAGIVIGNTATVLIEASDRHPILAAPIAAVVPCDGRDCVLIRRSSGYALTPVQLGEDDGKHVAILSGAAVGDRVAVGSPDDLLRLRENAR